MERSLLLFDPDFPCWDEETFALAGEAPEAIRHLRESGYVSEDGGCFTLTAKGTEKRREVAAEYYVEAKPIPIFDPAAALLRNKLYLLMDRAFVGQFGIKEYSANEALEIVPYLGRDELYTFCGGQIEYIWPKNPLVMSFTAAFPRWGVGSREYTPPGQAGMNRWRAETHAKTGSLRCDLILRSRYDFELYRHQPPYPTDRFRMKDADRLFFFRVTDENIDDFYTQIGLLHLFMLGQRRVYIPGYADIDSHEQENWTMAVAAADDEDSLEAVSAKLQSQGRALIDPANPLFIVGTSLERLRGMQKPKDTVYDWFCEDTVHITRPDV